MTTELKALRYGLRKARKRAGIEDREKFINELGLDKDLLISYGVVTSRLFWKEV